MKVEELVRVFSALPPGAEVFELCEGSPQRLLGAAVKVGSVVSQRVDYHSGGHSYLNDFDERVDVEHPAVCFEFSGETFTKEPKGRIG